MRPPDKILNLAGIDVARGFAALSVFVYHYNIGTVIRQRLGIDVSFIISYPGAKLAVPLFFLISGFCIHLSQIKQDLNSNVNGGTSSYVERRFWRIFPAYFVILVFSCLMEYMTDGKANIGDFFLHLFFLQALSTASFNSINLVLWTISVEVMLYAIYPLWRILRRRWGLGPAMGIGVAVTLSSWVVSALWLYPYSLPTIWFVLNLWGGWLFGAYLAEVYVRSGGLFLTARWWSLGVLSTFAFVLLTEFGCFAGRGSIVEKTMSVIVWAWPLSALIVLLPKMPIEIHLLFRVPVRVLGQIGVFSYSLYLLHEPLIGLRNLIWKPIHNQEIRTAIWLLWFPLILFLSSISYRLFEAPFMRQSSRRAPRSMRAELT